MFSYVQDSYAGPDLSSWPVSHDRLGTGRLALEFSELSSCACPIKPWRQSSGCMCHMDNSWPAPPARIWPSVLLYGFSAHMCAGMFGCTLSISESPAFFRSALQTCWWTWQSRGTWWSVVVALGTRRQIKSFNFSSWCTTPCASSFGPCSWSPCCRTGRCAEAGHSA